MSDMEIEIIIEMKNCSLSSVYYIPDKLSVNEIKFVMGRASCV